MKCDLRDDLRNGGRRIGEELRSEVLGRLRGAEKGGVSKASVRKIAGGASVKLRLGFPAHFRETGAKARTVKPKKAKALKISVAGGIIFRPSARIPRLPPRPVLRPSYEAKKGAIKRMAAEAAKKGIVRCLRKL